MTKRVRQTAIPSADQSPVDAARPRTLRNWHATLFFALAVALFFFRILLGHTFLWEDFLLQAYPYRVFAATSLAHGSVPLWNPYAFAGMPFLADIQSAIFYLPNLLLTPLLQNSAVSFRVFEMLVIAHYIVAAAGMFALACGLGIERAYATLAGLAYALSGWMIVHAIHPGFIESAALLPWIVWALHRSIVRRDVRYALGSGVLLAETIFAGAPQIAYFAVLVIVAFAGVAALSAWPNRRTRVPMALGFPALALVVAVGLSAIQLLPTRELAPLSERDALAPAVAASGSLPLVQLATVVMPKFFGTHTATANTSWNDEIYGSFWETTFYWGIPVLLLALFAATTLWRDRRVRWLTAMAVLSTLVALGDQFVLYPIMLRVVPGIAVFRIPARFMLLATFAVALLAAFGLRAFVERALAAPRMVERVLAATCGVAALIALGAQLVPLPPAIGAAGIATARGEGLMALVLVVLCAAAGLMLTRRVWRAEALIGAILLLHMGDMVRFGGTQNDGALDAEQYYHGRPDIRAVIDRLHQAQQLQPSRIASRDGPFTMFDRNLGMVDQLPLIEGYTPLRLRRRLPPASTPARTLDLLNATYRVTADSAAGTMHLSTAPTVLPRAWVVAQDTVIANDSAAAAWMRRPEFDPHAQVVLSATPAVPFLAPLLGGAPMEANMKLVDYRANAITISLDAPHPAIIVFSEIWYPGWSATVDGIRAQVMRANWNLRAVYVTPGAHMVRMAFTPTSFRLGAFISGAMVVLVALAWAIGRPRRRTPAAESTM